MRKSYNDLVSEHTSYRRTWGPDGASPRFRIALADDSSPTGVALYVGSSAEAAAKLAWRALCAPESKVAT
jgi:hypothetical protein